MYLKRFKDFVYLPDTLMDSTESFEDDLTRIFNEFFCIVSKEKIISKHSFAFGEVILSLFEVKLHIQTKQIFSINSKPLKM